MATQLEDEATTRLCIKNLPARLVEEDALRTFIESRMAQAQQRGRGALPILITDARLVRRKDGASRKFCFVGFQTVAMARAVQQELHRTYLGSSRLSIEFAQPQGSKELNRPWSKYSEGSSSHLARTVEGKDAPAAQKTKPAQTQPVKERDYTVADWVRSGMTQQRAEELVQEVQFRDFLLAMKAKTSQSRQSWANDAVTGKKAVNATEKKEDETKRLGDASSSSSSSSSPEEEAPSLAANVTVSDADYFKSKQVESPALLNVLPDSSATPVDWKPSGQLSMSAFRTIADHGRLFVRNLPFTATEEELTASFAPFGHPTQVHIPKTEAGQSKGFGFVQFQNPADGARAYVTMDGAFFQGRRLHIVPAQPRLGAAVEDATAQDDTSTHKRQMEAKRRAEGNEDPNAAPRSHWSTLFVRSDTVADAIAHKYGVSKADLLDPSASSSGDAAVRMALAESQVLQETKKFLSDHGVHVDAFDAGKAAALAASGRQAAQVRRSNVVLLVKNLPFRTSEQELMETFEPHGEVTRLVLPPSRAVGIVEFAQAADAKRAFRQLAYRRFRNQPLYLEWAPVGVFKQKEKKQEKEKEEKKKGEEEDVKHAKEAMAHAEQAVRRPAAAAALNTVEAFQEDDDDESHFTIFVKNIAFATKEETLRKLFSKIGDSFVSVRIPTKERVAASGKREVLSMGFGFVEYSAREDAQRALRELNRKMVDGHALKLSVSERPSQRPAAPVAAMEDTGSSKLSIEDVSTTKVVVKNLPFQATARDIKRICSAFAQVTRVRVPKKFDGGHRGFAFVEFATRQETMNALERLGNAHLYGRRLVFEFAKSVEENGGGSKRAAPRRDAKRVHKRLRID